MTQVAIGGDHGALTTPGDAALVTHRRTTLRVANDSQLSPYDTWQSSNRQYADSSGQQSTGLEALHLGAVQTPRCKRDAGISGAWRLGRSGIGERRATEAR